MQQDDDNDDWGRPLGVVSIVSSSSVPYLLVLEPSGIIQRYKAFAMGKYSNDILPQLADIIQVETNTTTEDLKEQLVKLIQSVVPSTKTDTSILVEILSEKGIDRTIIGPSG